MDKVEITEENFSEYFFDVRTHKPQQGQIIACFRAIAELVEGHEKKQIIDLLVNTDKTYPTTQVMRKLLHASEIDAIRIPKAIVGDILEGMTPEECLQKPYKYTIEMFFYTKPEYVPEDPHWSKISILNLEEYLNNGGAVLKSKILE